MTQEKADAWKGARGSTLPMLYSKTSKGAVNTWLAWVENDEVVVRWGQEEGKQQTARFKCEATNVGRSNERDPNHQAVFEAHAKWKKQVLKKYHWSREHVLTTVNKKPMLAKKFADEEKKVTYPAMGQPKLDGCRCLAYMKDGKVYLQSRGGKPFTVHHIMEQLTGRIPEGVTLDGELYSHGTPLQTINSWVKRPQEDSEKLVYMLYDVIVDNDMEFMDALKRQRYLDAMFVTGHPHKDGVLANLPHVQRTQTVVLNTREEVTHYHDEWVMAGYEGAIVRLMKGLYRYAYRSSDLLKLKAFEDDEFEIVGWERGKGKFLNVPTFVCISPKAVDPEDNTFKATFKGDESERAAMCDIADQQIGKQLTVRYFNYTPDGKPFHGHGIAVREPGT